MMPATPAVNPSVPAWPVAWRALHDPRWFDPEQYRRRNGEGWLPRLAPRLHFLLFGWRERRLPRADFDPASYLAAHPGAAGAAGLLPWGLHPDAFAPPDATRSGRPAPAPWETLRYDLARQMALVDASGFFDPAQYRRIAADTPDAHANPLRDFCLNGWRVGRAPAAAFPLRDFAGTLPAAAHGHLNPLAWFAWHTRVDTPPDGGARAWRNFLARRHLRTFLADGGTLDFPAHTPHVSVILPLHNGAEWTLLALQALRLQTEARLEVRVVDDASTDETPALLDRVRGLHRLRLNTNQGFLHACNTAAREARGTHLLFLNSDCFPAPGALDAACATLESDTNIGSVCGRLVHPDGRLQEAGCIVWADGRTDAHGRGGDPADPAFRFQRDVDYGSAAFLLTRRDLFERLEGFDPHFAPAYYEDVDYCMRLRAAGYRTVYEPRARAEHIECASSPMEAARDRMLAHARRFRERHAAALALHPVVGREPLLVARSATRRKGLLFLDECVPHDWLGSGCPRALRIVRSLAEMGESVAFHPLFPLTEPLEAAYASLPRTVEVTSGGGSDALEHVLRERAGALHAIIVSRPEVMLVFDAVRRRIPGALDGVRIVYDAEAVYAVRDALRPADETETGPAPHHGLSLEEELALARTADAVWAVSAQERDLLSQAGCANVRLLSHAVEADASPTPFRARQGVAYIGSFHDEHAPNTDAVLWFARHVWPRLLSRLGEGVTFDILGHAACAKIPALASATIRVLGRVPDAARELRQRRILVAPARFGSGVPLKVYTAAAAGLPAVVSPLLAEQLAWEPGLDLSVADARDPESFADACAALYRDEALWNRIQAGALAQVRAGQALAVFNRMLAATLDAPPGA